MCQIRVVLEENDKQTTVMEQVTSLEVARDGVRLSTFFEAPLILPATRISRIDFLAGTVVLTRVQASHTTP
ncbi:MAG: RNA-binding protein [Desulfobulbaceae bacterium A2]|nr:MAG: RNA-binding protein [Desulfobulbaceae bacterium A2]